MILDSKNTNTENIIDWVVNLLNYSALVRGLLLFVAWIAIWQVGRLVEYTDHASVWFPVAGFTFSCLLVLGRRAFIPIMFGAIVITIWQGEYYQSSLTYQELVWAGFLFGLAHILPYWVGAIMVRKLAQKVDHSAPQLIVTFLLVSGITAFLVTLLVITSLVFTSQMDLTEVGKTLLPFWVGDLAGVIVLTPLFSGILIFLFPNPYISLKEFTQQRLGSLQSLVFKIGMNVCLIFITMLLAYLSDSRESSFAIFFLAITHMWIASTESPKFNILSLAISSVTIVLLVHLLELMEYVMVYQFAINVIAANALFGIAIPQLKAYNRELENKVFTDALTQVSSRHYMVQRAELEIEQSHERDSVLSLVVFDLDDFKLINDKYGHIAGDKALQNICTTAKKTLRKNDVIARFGGDEFVLLLPGLDRNACEKRITKIKDEFNKIQIGESKLCSSFGIAQLLPNEDFDALFHRADLALYKSKMNGGNQISIAMTQ